MALPGDLNATVITGTYLDASGAPLSGSVTFTPSAILSDSTGSTVIPSYGKTYQLSAGHFQTDPLAATDNSDITPSGWSYLVTVAIQNLTPLTFSVLVPHTPSPVDISALMPVVTPGSVADFLPELTANVSVSASGTLALNTVTEVSASSAARTMTLPSAAAGDLIVVEKSDSSVNTVAVTGSIRGSAGTITLKLQNESEMLYGWAGSWWPVAGHKTLGSLDARYAQVTGATMTGALVEQVPNIVFDGDSLTSGTGALPFNNFPLGNDYPSQVVASLDHRGTYYNVGVGGEQVSTMITNGPTVVDAKLVSGANNVVCFDGGTNDLVSTDSAATTYSRIVTYCQARQAAGWKVVISTLTPRSDAGTPGDFDTQRLSVNSSIRTNWPTFANGIADIGADANMGTSGQETNTQYYNGDLVHSNPNGYRVRAGYVLAALSTLGIRGHQHGDRSGLVSDLFVPACMFALSGGSPTTALVSHTNTWALHHGTVDSVGCPVLIPQDWLSYTVQVVWSNTAGASGNAIINGAYLPAFSGSNLATAHTSGGNVTVASPTAFRPVYTTLFTINNQAGGAPSRTFMDMIIQRTGTSGSDTLTGDTVNVIGLYLFRST